MNIIFPTAGFGTRFSKKGYRDPKPFIKVKDKYLIEYALSSLQLPGKYYIITCNLDYKYISILNEIFKKYKIDGSVVNMKFSTLSATETCYFLNEIFEQSGYMTEELIITNNDQYTPWDFYKFIDFKNENATLDAIVTTYDHKNVILNQPSLYSHIKVNENDLAIEFREKFAISEHALNGIHYWRKARDFFDSAKLLLEDTSFKTEKYISYTFNYLIKSGKKISYYKMEDHEYTSLGSPEEIERNINRL